MWVPSSSLLSYLISTSSLFMSGRYFCSTAMISRRSFGRKSGLSSPPRSLINNTCKRCLALSAFVWVFSEANALLIAVNNDIFFVVPIGPLTPSSSFGASCRSVSRVWVVPTLEVTAGPTWDAAVTKVLFYGTQLGAAVAALGLVWAVGLDLFFSGSLRLQTARLSALLV